MSKNDKASAKKRRFFASFYHAGKGLKAAFFRERNIRIFMIISILALLTGYFLKISTTEWLIIIFAISTNIVAELFNTAIEVLCDRVSPKKDNKIAKAKDISAAAVLLLSMMALAIGLVIFLPRVIQLF